MKLKNNSKTLDDRRCALGQVGRVRIKKKKIRLRNFIVLCLRVVAALKWLSFLLSGVQAVRD